MEATEDTSNDKGVAVGCCKCKVMHIRDPEFKWESVDPKRETVELFAHMSQIAEAQGWAVHIENGEAMFLCPACLKLNKDAETRILPRYKAKGPCVKCGESNPKTQFCDGKPPSCGLGAIRDHIHRTCLRCGYGLIESCLDEK